jgi:hypothetical protein
MSKKSPFCQDTKKLEVPKKHQANLPVPQHRGLLVPVHPKGAHAKIQNLNRRPYLSAQATTSLKQQNGRENQANHVWKD